MSGTKRKPVAKKRVAPKKKVVEEKVAEEKVAEEKAVVIETKIEEVGAIAILCHFRTGSVLLRKVLVACGLVDCNERFKGLGADINGVGNALFHNFIETPGTAVVETLKLFKKKAEAEKWKHYGIKVDHVLQAVCWEGVGKPFLVHWPDARYVISIRHPAGILYSFEKIRRDTPKQDPGFTDQQIVDSWASTYEATKFLIEEKDATVVVYPGYYHKTGRIKDVVKSLGLEWTEKAEAHIDKAVLKDSTVTPAEINEFEEKYPEASEMFDEFLDYAK